MSETPSARGEHQQLARNPEALERPGLGLAVLVLRRRSDGTRIDATI